MIRLFNSTETDFTHNGVAILDDIAISDTCIITNEINGVYSLEMEISICDNLKWKELQLEMIIRVPTVRGEQLFRVKELVNGFLRIKVYGKHIFFDLENNFILDTNIVQKDGRGALNQILSNMSNNMINSYYGSSDISIINNSRLVRKNVVSSLLSNDDNSFVNRWNGELNLDNFNFSFNTRIGADRGVQIRYAKNCTGYEGNVNAYNLCTRIVPVGYNGIMLEGIKWVDSPNITKYPQIYTYEVKFENIKVKENADDEDGFNTLKEAQFALRQSALDYFIQTKCDNPSFSARVNFISLEKTEEYKDLQILERVELGDDINVYLSKIDVFATSRVVKTRYNFFTQKFIEIEIGELKANTFKDLINLKDKIDLVQEQLGGNTWKDILNKSLDEATKLLEEGLKGSHVITMKNQIIIGDNPAIENMINCIVINKNGIGFSNNGYLPDRLISAMTIDGKINASCITTGQLNAALVKTGLLMSANNKTWINMEDGTFNFAEVITYDGKTFNIDTNVIKATFNSINSSVEIGDTGFLIRNGMLTIMDAFNKKIFGTDLDGGITFNGRLQPNDNTLKLFGEECKLVGGDGALRRNVNNSTYDSVTVGGAWVLFNQYSNGGTRYTGITTDIETHTQLFNQTTMLKLLNLGAAGVQARYVGDTGYCPMTASSFTQASKSEFKENIHEPLEVDFKKILMESPIKEYNLIAEREVIEKIPTVLLADGSNPIKPDPKLGFLLEDLNEYSRRLLHPTNSDGVDLYAMCSVLWKICQEQEIRLQNLEK